MNYNIISIKECGNVDGVNYVYGRYCHFIPNCENVLIVESVMYPIRDDNKENIKDIVKEILCRQKRQ